MALHFFINFLAAISHKVNSAGGEPIVFGIFCTGYLSRCLQHPHVQRYTLQRSINSVLLTNYTTAIYHIYMAKLASKMFSHIT